MHVLCDVSCTVNGAGINWLMLLVQHVPKRLLRTPFLKRAKGGRVTVHAGVITTGKCQLLDPNILPPSRSPARSLDGDILKGPCHGFITRVMGLLQGSWVYYKGHGFITRVMGLLQGYHLCELRT